MATEAAWPLQWPGEVSNCTTMAVGELLAMLAVDPARHQEMEHICAAFAYNDADVGGDLGGCLQRCSFQQLLTDIADHGLPLMGHAAALEVPARVAVDETVILLHPALPLVGVSIVMERERQQNDSLVNG